MSGFVYYGGTADLMVPANQCLSTALCEILSKAAKGNTASFNLLEFYKGLLKLGFIKSVCI